MHSSAAQRAPVSASSAAASLPPLLASHGHVASRRAAMASPHVPSSLPPAAAAVAADGVAGAAGPPPLDRAAYSQRWFDIWAGGLQPGEGFDKGAASQQLLALLQSGQVQVQGKRVLVPGCGRGYDVAAFASSGAAASVGLDLSADAVAAARAECARLLAAQPAAAAACELAAGDFVAYAHPSGAAFDVGYDYTFLCALHPDMRQDWAASWARLLAPGGQLVTLVYPVDASMDPQHGPPWPVTPQLYSQLLPPAGFELVSLQPVPKELSHPSRQGREWVGRWRRTSCSSSVAPSEAG